jgi:hypothetical protein
MSYSRRQLYAMGEPLGDGATRREVGGKIIYGTGGGGDTPSSTKQKQTVTQDLPAWAQPYAKESLAKASALTDTPYQPYSGERIAQFTPLQQQAFGRAEGQQVAGQVGFGTGLAGLAGVSSFGDQGTAASFMSPYMDAVVQQQMESAQRQADIAGTQRGAQAVRAGAFGGSRQAIENAEANRALASQKGQIQATGLQSAFERAQQQFNQEQATRLNAAQTLGQLGQQQFGQEMDITGQQFGMGQQQRQATQDILSQQYQDFLNQQRAPYDQLAFMTSMIRGTPMGGTTAQYSTAPAPSYTSQLIGAGTAAAGAYGAYKGAAGGEIPSYAAGGIASLNQPEMAAMAGGMSDQQLQQTQGLPSITELARMTLAAEAQQRAQMRQAAMAQQAMMQQQPQATVAEEQMAALGGISDLPAPNLENLGDGMAGGGIVAFQTGDMVPDPVMVDEERKRAAARLNAGIGAPPQVAAPAPVGGGILGDFTRLGESQIAAETKASQSEREGLAALKSDFEKLQEKAKTYGSDKEQRLKKREEEAKGSSKQNVFMTMMDIGLRVAAGQSPNALSNIAEGAQQGLKGFQERLNTINANKEKLDEDYARLYEIREEKVNAVGERLLTLKQQESKFEADAARRLAAIGSAVEGKKIDYKLGKEKSADAFRNATAGSQTPERQAYADLLKKNKGDAVAALTEFNQMFGKKEIDPGVKAGVDFLERQIGEIMARPVPLPDDEAQIQRIQKRINELKGGGASSAGQPVTTKAQYDALPKGATYVDPNGVTRTKG